MKPEREETPEEIADRLRRYREAAELLRRWRSEPEDESLDWPTIAAVLDANGDPRLEPPPTTTRPTKHAVAS